jgi:hypothetical protein
MCSLLFVVCSEFDWSLARFSFANTAIQAVNEQSKNVSEQSSEAKA